jgi:hypothetical protein
MGSQWDHTSTRVDVSSGTVSVNEVLAVDDHVATAFIWAAGLVICAE